MQDCVIVGGGPGGLAAALYLARFRLACTLLDTGSARASLIPRCRNFPGFPEGIPGPELLERMRGQLARYGVSPLKIEALSVEQTPDGLRVKTADGGFAGKTVLLATGMRDKRPPFVSDEDHDAALHSGLLHYCPVCDGYEVSDKHVVVLGSGPHGVKEALFMCTFTDNVALVCPAGAHHLSDEDRKRLRCAGVTLMEGPVEGLRLEEGRLCYSLQGRQFATGAIYVAMGCEQHSGLAEAIGAEISEQGCIVVDAHQRTSVKRMYAVGDVVAGLDQIVTAIGQAAIAATTIRNDLQDELGRC